MESALRSKSELPREEFYFSADQGRPPVTIAAKSFEEAVAEYNRRFDISPS